ncbi:MAG TPA: hypothetical protein VNO32_53075 [Candidatus Acidoferrum sp.]|jgi:hypothetical protein|nr:hypothetical protein [Candidatus Acidoferrum sp.]
MSRSAWTFQVFLLGIAIRPDFPWAEIVFPPARGYRGVRSTFHYSRCIRAVSKYQISNGENGKGHQQPGNDRDQKPIPIRWPVSRQTEHVCGQVRLRKGMR